MIRCAVCSSPHVPSSRFPIRTRPAELLHADSNLVHACRDCLMRLIGQALREDGLVEAVEDVAVAQAEGRLFF